MQVHFNQTRSTTITTQRQSPQAPWTCVLIEHPHLHLHLQGSEFNPPHCGTSITLRALTINDDYTNMIETNIVFIFLSELNRWVAVNDDDDRTDKKLQQVIERVGRSWWTWQWSTPYCIHAIPTGTFFKKCWTVHWQRCWWPLFSLERKTHGGGVKSKEGIRIALKNKHNLVYCVFTPHPLTMSTVQGLQVHTANDAAIKKKRLLLKNYSETKQSIISPHDEIRYRANSHMVYCLPHTPFTLYVAETNNNRISTLRDPNSITRVETFTCIKKGNQLHLL